MWCSISMNKIILAPTLSQRSPHNLLNDCIVCQELVANHLGTDLLTTSGSKSLEMIEMFDQCLARISWNDCIVFLALVAWWIFVIPQATSARNTMQSLQEISSQPLRERQGREDFFMLIEHHMYNKCSKHNAIILVITSPPLRERQGQEVFCHVDRVLETRSIHFKKLRWPKGFFSCWSNIHF